MVCISENLANMGAAVRARQDGGRTTARILLDGEIVIVDGWDVQTSARYKNRYPGQSELRRLRQDVSGLNRGDRPQASYGAGFNRIEFTDFW